MRKLFSFKLDGVDAFSLPYEMKTTCEGNVTTTIYHFECGLKVTNVYTDYPEFDAFEWVNYFENTAKSNSPIISEIWDCDYTVKMQPQNKRIATAWRPDTSDITMIYAPKGSAALSTDFDITIDDSGSNWRHGLCAGEGKNYSSSGGRSSNGTAPFFHVRRHDEGVIVGLGWTGQWNCRIQREDEGVRVLSKIEDGEFYLYPNEKIHTSSATFMLYSNLSFFEAHNKWRNFLRKEITPIKSVKSSPFCLGLWGGMPTSEAIRRVEVVDNASIPFNCVWMDAGWCGANSQPTANEFEGDWFYHTGDWRISKSTHPNALVDLSEKIRSTGREYLLWFEPERVIKTVPDAVSHPEYFLQYPYASKNALLNLGDENALSYCIETISSIILKLNLSVYRQDFNTEPLDCWRANDTENRKGLTEIKYVNGLYRFLDELLHRFPSLIIDNCASGGRRIDMQTMRRSIPLWRSDLQCPANPKPEASQMHGVNYALWLPYSGTGTGRVYDDYCARSAFTAALTTNYAFSSSDAFGDDEEKLNWLKNMANDYLKARPYFDGDMYPLTTVNTDETAWQITQWHCPKAGDGMLQIFKRSRSPFTEATVQLHGIDTSKDYLVSDIDGGETTVSGKTLCDGYDIRITEKRVAKILFYKPL